MNTAIREIVESFVDKAEDLVAKYAGYLERKPDAYDLIHHAWMQGAHAADVDIFMPNEACPYAQRQYRMAWLWGYDIGRRINLRDERIERLQQIIIGLGRPA